MKIDVQLVHAFVEGDGGGNPAGVVLDADALSDAQKQRVARLVGYSETAFVSASASADFKLDFFTPNRRIAHCGHATIATFSYLAQLGRITGPDSSKETIDGNRAIQLRGELAFMEQTAPVYGSLEGWQEMIRASLQLDPSALLPGAVPRLVNTGNSFVLVPVASASILARLQPDLDLIGRVSEALGLVGYYAFTPDTRQPGRQAAARMFAPLYEIAEEAATGMAAGPLAAYLHDQLGVDAHPFLIEQGAYMPEPSPSLIQVEILKTGSRIDKLFVGGKGRVTGRKTVEL
ncbi:MAG TPA: PhzF family phenazine biosynthesis protein [Cytophagales bacterium]|jgi:PhzF family phenazine biosynthesis protein